MKNTAAIILAAGKGTRLKSPPTQNKVTLSIGSKPIIAYTVDHVLKSGVSDIFVVVGFASDSVKSVLGDKVTYVTQPNQDGTGDAVKVALQGIPSRFENILSLYGDDSAFYPPSLLASLILNHEKSQADITLLSLEKENPTGLGRILRNSEGDIIGIVEEKVATEEQKKITEVNAGLYCFSREFIDRYIEDIPRNPVSGEYYLTDIIALAVEAQAKVNGIIWADNFIWQGVNTPEELKKAHELKQQVSIT